MVARSVQADNNPDFEVKARTNSSAKEVIAQSISSLIQDGESIMLSAGSTSAAVARHLSRKKNLTVITNGSPIADEFVGTDANIYVTGGRRTANQALVGPLAVASLKRLNATTLITSVHAADATGLTTPSLEEGETLSSMFSACQRVIVGIDHSKWGVKALYTFADWQQVDVAVVDSEIPDEALTELKELVKKVVVAS